MATFGTLHRNLLLTEVAVLAGRLGDRMRSRRPSAFTAPVSQVASGAHTADAAYLRWVDSLGEANPNHRKVWEWSYILEAFERHELLQSGRRILGFGVGREPLVAALAVRGVDVTATDQASSG